MIDGRLVVVPWCTPAEDWAESLFRDALELGPAQRPGGMALLSKAIIPIPAWPRPTALAPDIALYPPMTAEQEWSWKSWLEHSPLLVGEVLGVPDRGRDVRYRTELFLAVPGIQEFWLIDARASARRPNLLAHRRHGDGWLVEAIPYGAAYRTPLLPEFTLHIRHRR